MSAKSTRPLIQNEMLDQDRLMKAVRRRTLAQKIDSQSIVWFYQHLWDYFEASFEMNPTFAGVTACKDQARAFNNILRKHLKLILEELAASGVQLLLDADNMEALLAIQHESDQPENKEDKE